MPPVLALRGISASLTKHLHGLQNQQQDQSSSSLPSATPSSWSTVTKPHLLLPRQTNTAATAPGNSASSNQLSGGAIAGIVIGSIVGLLLLLWLLRSCTNGCGLFGPGGKAEPPPERTYIYEDRPHHRSRSRHSHHHHHHSRHRSPRYSSDGPVVIPVVDRSRRYSAGPQPPPATYVYDSSGRGRSSRRSSRGYV